ncbi:hypothetical protein DSECCO2_550810 [anaerobic digester metagenome]
MRGNAAVLHIHKVFIHLTLGYQIGQVCGSDANGDWSLRDAFRESPDLSAICCAPVETVAIAAHTVDIQLCIDWFVETCRDVVTEVRAIITAESTEFLFPQHRSATIDINSAIIVILHQIVLQLMILYPKHIAAFFKIGRDVELAQTTVYHFRCVVNRLRSVLSRIQPIAHIGIADTAVHQSVACEVFAINAAPDLHSSAYSALIDGRSDLHKGWIKVFD